MQKLKALYAELSLWWQSLSFRDKGWVVMCGIGALLILGIVIQALF